MSVISARGFAFLSFGSLGCRMIISYECYSFLNIISITQNKVDTIGYAGEHIKPLRNPR